MKIYFEMIFHPGTKANPRPSVKLVATAHTKDQQHRLETMIHSVLVDCPFPSGELEAMTLGLDRLQVLRQRKDPLFRKLVTEQPLRLTEVMVG